MKEILKYIAFITGCLTIAYVALTVRDCSPAGVSPGRVEQPADSGYLPISVQDYRPNILPIGKKNAPPVDLPRSVKTTEVRRVISIQTRGPVQIIELKDGRILVPGNSDSTSVAMINFSDPLLQFGLRAGIGVTIAHQMVTPALSISLISFYDRFSIPMVVDLQSVGIGMGAKVYHDIVVSPIISWRFSDTQRSIKLNVSFQL